MHITTFSKVQMNPLCPKQEEIRIEDIAHAQSLMTRANGHFRILFRWATQYCLCQRSNCEKLLIQSSSRMSAA